MSVQMKKTFSVNDEEILRGQVKCAVWGEQEKNSLLGSEKASPAGGPPRL